MSRCQTGEQSQFVGMLRTAHTPSQAPSSSISCRCAVWSKDSPTLAITTRFELSGWMKVMLTVLASAKAAGPPCHRTAFAELTVALRRSALQVNSPRTISRLGNPPWRDFSQQLCDSEWGRKAAPIIWNEVHVQTRHKLTLARLSTWELTVNG